MTAPTLTYAQFSGSVPRVAPHLLQESVASYARDVNFMDGHIHPLFKSKKMLDLQATTQTVYKHDCCWLEFPNCISVAAGSVTCREFYVTGAAPFPCEARVKPDCTLSWRRLGFPCPTVAPTVVYNGAPTKSVEGRSYCYAYVNSVGRESQMSPGSKVRNINDGDQVIVSGWTVPAPEWDIVKVRIYRTVSGALSAFQPEAQKIATNANDTFWMKVGDVPMNALNFVDQKLNEELTTANIFRPTPPPPVDLQGIGLIKSMNVQFGFVENRLYFTENNNPDSWPHFFTLDDKVRAVTESDGMIYVATDGHPYVISGNDDCDRMGCRDIQRSSTAMPYAGFGPNRITPVPSGAVYPSVKGLAQINKMNVPTLITYSLYSPEQWAKLYPESLTPVYNAGKLLVFGPKESFMLAIKDGSEGLWHLDSHTSLSETPRAAWETREGQVMLQKEDGLYLFNAPDAGHHDYVWRSKEFRNGKKQKYSAVRITIEGGGSARLRILVDKKAVYDRILYRSQIVRLPAFAVGLNWQLELEGQAIVSGLSMAATTDRVMQ